MFFCCTIIAGELLLVFIASILSVYIDKIEVTISSVPRPPNIKLPVISKLLLYILLTINLFFASGNSLIISVFNSETPFKIILLVTVAI